MLPRTLSILSIFVLFSLEFCWQTARHSSGFPPQPQRSRNLGTLWSPPLQIQKEKESPRTTRWFRVFQRIFPRFRNVSIWDWPPPIWLLWIWGKPLPEEHWNISKVSNSLWFWDELQPPKSSIWSLSSSAIYPLMIWYYFWPQDPLIT